MCPVTFFAFWRRVRWRVWRACRPSLEFSSGFWAVPDPYCTIPGRNRADQLFFVARQPDAFVSQRESQNVQNRPKSTEISQKLENLTFSQLEHSCNFVDRSGTLEAFSRRVLGTLRTELPCPSPLTAIFCEIKQFKSRVALECDEIPKHRVHQNIIPENT